MEVGTVSQIRKAGDAYKVAIDTGIYKKSCPIYILLVKAMMGGYFAALGGHAAMVLASYYYMDGHHGGAKLAFGVIFSGALLCIVFTGTDLVTSNCMNFAFLAYSRQVTLFQYLTRMGTSLLGNYCGAILGAALLTAGTGYFSLDKRPEAYLKAIYDAKTALPFWRTMLSAIGCNSYVCMAVWCCYVAMDSAGCVLAVMILITSFAVAGFEHIVANFYTLHAALFSCEGTSVGVVYGRNLAPTLLGNYIGGSLIIALPLWLFYGFKPKATQNLNETPVVI
ncbi:Formate/nitrite transporter family protein [Babesia bovis T2Bo]|uniref:Formate-nitrite transporter n=1 Tax=Babesia bovis TaxID=5865 RepID=A7AX62_BABBO|nr:Formate/nitrite transporter family protein [Babesia bovis T2Bo]EDO05135.1 Formate/nitrite transporter family protein [Babesia bovis T2Bo]BAN65840.1 formate/nitrite transporter family protein, putative [Babesia bovis]|eukprot:XP_001608703.1 formate/nitrite transporter family protein [Babesia bovis T2Bo]